MLFDGVFRRQSFGTFWALVDQVGVVSPADVRSQGRSLVEEQRAFGARVNSVGFLDVLQSLGHQLARDGVRRVVVLADWSAGISLLGTLLLFDGKIVVVVDVVAVEV